MILTELYQTFSIDEKKKIKEIKKKIHNNNYQLPLILTAL